MAGGSIIAHFPSTSISRLLSDKPVKKLIMSFFDSKSGII